MSRTHSHRPYWAWFNNPAVRIERHDHRNGPCDLPDPDIWFDQLRERNWYAAWRAYSCTYDIDLHLIPRLCGCFLCRGDVRQDRRNDRHRAKLELREHLGRIQRD